MKPYQLKQVLKEIILKTDITPLIWGPKGVGKSEIIKTLVEELKIETQKPWGFVDLRISTQEISDLTGIPKTVTWNIKKEKKLTETDWSVPSWFPTLEKLTQKERKIPSNGIIFLDEINRGGPQETQAIFQFVLDKKIHTHVLAPGWKIVAAANPPTEEYLVNELDDAFLDRFLQLTLKPDVTDWLKWAHYEGNIANEVQEFINSYPDMLVNISESESEWVPTVHSTPRAWEAVSIIRKNCDIPSELEREVYGGLIGYTNAVSFMNFLSEKFKVPVKAEEIMKNYSKVRDKILEIIRENKIDIQNMMIQDIIKFARKKPEKFNTENFYKFLMDLKNDFKVILVHPLLEIPEVYSLLNNHEKLVEEITRIMNEVEDKQLAT